ncbi:MAG TPA: hypothetical protein PLX20_15185 [Rhodocyclaceae bacterium]|nr:hypothetical protein [Rhodocyclaceae bacterium]HMV54296.1 hypothetical protein [Rhodocyclaceae bacterium]HMZ83231.1 hypothetical protein [Rhodocyclaceae bacterium]HNA03266.1 hypothetical protein [Rhodocyclaceae bacterium]HNB78548.1 hypothetical protein [Rhodocyclaceae bacterium]
MKWLGIVILVVLTLIGAFALVNWNALATPVPVSLIVGTVDMPLGMILLSALVLVVLLLGLYILLLRTAMYTESRRMAQELAAQRELADKAEASRFTELSAHLDQQVAGLRQAMTEVANGVSADIGQMDDKLDRVLGRG